MVESEVMVNTWKSKANHNVGYGVKIDFEFDNPNYTNTSYGNIACVSANQTNGQEVADYNFVLAHTQGTTKTTVNPLSIHPRDYNDKNDNQIIITNSYGDDGDEKRKSEILFKGYQNGSDKH